MARSAFDRQKIDFRASFASLRFLPRFFREIKQVAPGLFYGNLLLRSSSALLPLALLWVGKLIIDEVVAQRAVASPQWDLLWQYVGIELLLAVAADLINRGIIYSDALLGDRYAIESSVKIIRKTAELELARLEDADFYDKLERARQQTTGRVGLMSNVLSQLTDLVVVFSLIGGVIVYEIWLLALLLLSVIPTILNEIKFSGTSYSLARSWTEERRELDYLRYAGASDLTAKEVKLFDLAPFIAERYRNLSEKYFVESRKLASLKASWGSFFNFISNLSYYGAYALIVFRTVIGLFTLGDLTFLAGSFNRLRGRLQGFFTRFNSITERSLYLQDYFEFIDFDENSSAKQRVRLPMPQSPKSGFEFVNVSFRYPGSEQWVLKNLNLRLEPGEKLALVGENGAGKTTLIKLLLGLYKPSEGEILFAGKPIDQYEPKSYRSYFGVIFQDFVRYELSLRENIAVGNIEKISDERALSEASSKSLAQSVIDQLPEGIEQRLGRRFRGGKNLSGGQWQKVAIARAYLKSASFLILDEPTSALDARAESELFERFIDLTENKSAVIISHRFSTVRIADRIVVLKDGQIIEEGTHEDLMKAGNLYNELFNLQAAGYIK